MTPAPNDLRARYRPSDVRVLFVGESPPAGGTFFYAGNSKLYFATKKAFQSSIPDLATEPFRESFSDLGCYLDDLCLTPVNHLKLTDREQKRERLQMRADGEDALAERIEDMRPDVVVLVMVGIEKNVLRALGTAGSRAHVVVLPFPGRPEHAARFDRELQTTLIDLRDRGSCAEWKSGSRKSVSRVADASTRQSWNPGARVLRDLLPATAFQTARQAVVREGSRNSDRLRAGAGR